MIPFKVPRKSELFQEDLYPETQADIPALTADEWWANKKNADPVMMSMADGGGSNKEQEELVITKVIFSYISISILKAFVIRAAGHAERAEQGGDGRRGGEQRRGQHRSSQT